MGVSMTGNRWPIVVLGIGNILLRDEGVGVRVAEQMLSINLPREVEVVDGGTAGADLLDVICNRRKVIIIDAVDADVPPGTILRTKPEEVNSDTSGRISLHELGIIETLAMAKMLNSSPEEVVLIGIKPDQIGCGLELSPEVAAAIPAAVRLVMQEISASAREHPC